jgi:hypothetical protein
LPEAVRRFSANKKTENEPSQRNETNRERARGQEEEILSTLRLAGERGCTNTELWAICHAVNSRISDLRKRGHRIEASPEGRGVWRYRLLKAAPTSPDPLPTGKSATEKQAVLPLFAKERE